MLGLVITGAASAAAVTLTSNVPFVAPILLVAVKVKLFVATAWLEDGLNTATPFELRVAQAGQVPVVEKLGAGDPPGTTVFVTVVPA